MQGPETWLVSPLSPPSRSSQIDLPALHLDCPCHPLGSDKEHLMGALGAPSEFCEMVAKCGAKQRGVTPFRAGLLRALHVLSCFVQLSRTYLLPYHPPPRSICGVLGVSGADKGNTASTQRGSLSGGIPGPDSRPCIKAFPLPFPGPGHRQQGWHQSHASLWGGPVGLQTLGRLMRNSG